MTCLHKFLDLLSIALNVNSYREHYNSHVQLDSGHCNTTAFTFLLIVNNKEHFGVIIDL